MNTIYTEEKFVGEKKEENCFEYHSISEINISHYSEKIFARLQMEVSYGFLL